MGVGAAASTQQACGKYIEAWAVHAQNFPRLITKRKSSVTETRTPVFHCLQFQFPSNLASNSTKLPANFIHASAVFATCLRENTTGVTWAE